ncbi:hypothetical protein ACFYO2_49620, partial [Streptomyces sp. NPDC006602]
MTRFLTPQELLQIAQTLSGDPACLDLGVLDAACARVQAHYMDRDVYASDWLKAAAMLETITLHEPLEAKNAFFRVHAFARGPPSVPVRSTRPATGGEGPVPPRSAASAWVIVT